MRVRDRRLGDHRSGDQPAPPTAQAAWQAAEVAGENIARAIENRPLRTWEHEDKGTVVSVGEKAVAHDVKPAFGISLPSIPSAASRPRT